MRRGRGSKAAKATPRRQWLRLGEQTPVAAAGGGGLGGLLPGMRHGGHFRQSLVAL